MCGTARVLDRLLSGAQRFHNQKKTCEERLENGLEFPTFDIRQQRISTHLLHISGTDRVPCQQSSRRWLRVAKGPSIWADDRFSQESRQSRNTLRPVAAFPLTIEAQ